MSLIEDLESCLECNQWNDNISTLNCCNKKICINCLNNDYISTHNCSDNSNNINSNKQESLQQQNNNINNNINNINNDKQEYNKVYENLYSSYLSINSKFNIGLGSSLNSLGSSADDDGFNDEEFDEDNIFEHILLPKDTLQGLSIRYHVSVNEIKKINNIHSEERHGKLILLIPKRPNQNRQQKEEILSNQEITEVLKKNIITHYMKKSKCSDQSLAETYLEKHSYHFIKALIDYNNNKLLYDIPNPLNDNQLNSDSGNNNGSIGGDTFGSFGSDISTSNNILNNKSISLNNQLNNSNNNINSNNNNQFKYEPFNLNNNNNNNSNNNVNSDVNNNNSNNLLNNSDFLIKSYREKYSDIPTKTKVHNINKPSIKKIKNEMRSCCSFF